MENKLKSFLGRRPRIYYFGQAVWWKFSELKARLSGTKTVQRKWERIDFNKTAKDRWREINQPHRRLLIEKIEKFQPLANILEIGCNWGQNLYLLAKKFPKINIEGIDINPKIIEAGREIFAEENIRNVKFFVGQADDLRQFPDRSFDIIFTDSVLMYIGPDKIQKALKEMIRAAGRALIFVEWHDENQKELEKYDAHIGVWRRNYMDLLKTFVSADQIHITKIPEEAWPEEGWQKFGHIIEVIL